jgi:hypothetical protein
MDKQMHFFANTKQKDGINTFKSKSLPVFLLFLKWNMKINS